MKWRITLVKDEYVGWNGQKVKARQEVKEFDDIMDAQNWFIHDSYFGETYTRSATWERVDEAPPRGHEPCPGSGQHWRTSALFGIPLCPGCMRSWGELGVAKEPKLTDWVPAHNRLSILRDAEDKA